MNGNQCIKTTTDGQRVTVEIPDGLPALMMNVAREASTLHTFNPNTRLINTPNVL